MHTAAFRYTTDIIRVYTKIRHVYIILLPYFLPLLLLCLRSGAVQTDADVYSSRALRVSSARTRASTEERVRWFLTGYSHRLFPAAERYLSIIKKRLFSSHVLIFCSFGRLFVSVLPDVREKWARVVKSRLFKRRCCCSQATCKTRTDLMRLDERILEEPLL